jgi:hypothetical protein
MPATRLVFAAAIFLDAALLFAVQPMFGKTLLPLVGGTPAVWNTCLVFFQVALLAGYALAWAGARLRHPRLVALLHLGLLAAAFTRLPIRLAAPGALSEAGAPTGWLLATLTLSLGLPYTVLAAGSPLLQHLFARSDDPARDQPYTLFAASNAGSLVALLGYPVLVEPRWPLSAQYAGWRWAFAALAVLVAACAWRVLRPRAAPSPAHGEPPAPAIPAASAPSPTTRERLHWLALAFVPSSLLVAVTSLVTTDIAAVPLLWILPLAAYLLSFIVGFAGDAGRVPLALAVRLAPLAMLTLVSLVFWGEAPRGIGVVAAPVLAFLVLALVAHGTLYERRPGADRLTGFYLWVALGGALGGGFAALLAPMLFVTRLELPITLALAAFLVPGQRRPVAQWQWVAVLAAAAAAQMVALEHVAVSWEHGRAGAIAMTGAMAVALLLTRRTPLLFGVVTTALVAAGELRLRTTQGVLARDRSFFGTHVVRRIGDRYGTLHSYVHGRTLHGAQQRELLHRGTPLTYYALEGPLGELFFATFSRATPARVGVVGLGAGTTAAYARAGDAFTFYELDPTVERMARDTTLFTYLHDAPVPTPVVLGDGRLSLAREPAGRFDLLVLDAFSSDAIPVHLATREAVALYVSRLAPGGIVAFHVSNRYLDLGAVLGAIAAEAGLAARERADVGPQYDSWVLSTRRLSSQWVALARTEAELAGLDTARWRPVVRAASVRPWTDDWSNLLAVFRWRPRSVGTAEPMTVSAPAGPTP